MSDQVSQVSRSQADIDKLNNDGYQYRNDHFWSYVHTQLDFHFLILHHNKIANDAGDEDNTK